MKRKILIFYLLLVILPLNVQALSGNVKITCDKNSLIINNNTTCHITATTDDEVSSLHSIINVENGLEIVSVNVSDIWEGDNDKVLDLYTADNKKDSFAIADFVIKATKTGNYKITLTDTTLGDKSFKEHKFDVLPYSITITNEINEEQESSSSTTTNKPSSSSSSSSTLPSSKPSSSLSSSSSNSQSNKKPIHKIELQKNVIYTDETIELSFYAETSGKIKISSSNSKIITTSSSSYDLEANETKIFKLTGINNGTSNITVEFIPTNKEYQTIKKTYQLTVKNIPNKNENVEVNPPTGNLLFTIYAAIGLLVISYLYWYLRTNKQKY